jgi:hypothetical protein
MAGYRGADPVDFTEKSSLKSHDKGVGRGLKSRHGQTGFGTMSCPLIGG